MKTRLSATLYLAALFDPRIGGDIFHEDAGKAGVALREAF